MTLAEIQNEMHSLVDSFEGRFFKENTSLDAALDKFLTAKYLAGDIESYDIKTAGATIETGVTSIAFIRNANVYLYSFSWLEE